MKKILIVDDNIDNRMTLKLLLRGFEDLEIHEAKNGKEALLACAQTKFDLVFMDIMMPDMDGVQATAEICKFDKKVMIIAVSALHADENKEAIMEAGAEDYITKPIAPAYFKERAEIYLRLVDLRHRRSFKSSPTNLFEIPVFSRSSVFSIEQECDLAELWGFYLIDGNNGVDTVSDYIRCVFNLGFKVLKENEFFKIIVEEDDKNFYFSFVDIHVKNEQVVHDAIKKELADAIYLVDLGKISLIAPKHKIMPTTKLQISEKEESSLNELIVPGQDINVAQSFYDTYINTMSADDYLEEYSINIMDKVDVLETIEFAAEKLIFKYEARRDIELVHGLAKTVGEYADVIDSLYEFGHLADSIRSLGIFLGKLSNDILDDKKRAVLSLLIASVVQDLKEWRRTIFIDKSTADIHYLDHSLLSSCVQIKLLLDRDRGSADMEFDLFW